jgi:menaquinol-cytochrome c reductase iron-sulfur subunit
LNRASILFVAVPDKRAEQKPKYTLEREIPGAFEGETVTRRRFMTGSAHTAGAIGVAAFTLPALGFAAGPIFKSSPIHWESVGPVDMFNPDNYIPVVLTVNPSIGEAGKTTAYVRKFNTAIDTDPYDRGTPYIAISTRCAHLGCPVRWVDAAERFICPCHGGVYDLLGRRVGGPPVRPLDRFYTRVNAKNEVELGPRFSVDSELKRFSPRDPAEPLDGIGQYLYPSRPGAQKL